MKRLILLLLICFTQRVITEDEDYVFLCNNNEIEEYAECIYYSDDWCKCPTWKFGELNSVEPDCYRDYPECELCWCQHPTVDSQSERRSQKHQARTIIDSRGHSQGGGNVQGDEAWGSGPVVFRYPTQRGTRFPLWHRPPGKSICRGRYNSVTSGSPPKTLRDYLSNYRNHP